MLCQTKGTRIFMGAMSRLLGFACLNRCDVVVMNAPDQHVVGAQLWCGQLKRSALIFVLVSKVCSNHLSAYAPINVPCKSITPHPYIGATYEAFTGDNWVHTSLSGSVVPSGVASRGIRPWGFKARYASDFKPPSTFGDSMATRCSIFFL